MTNTRLLIIDDHSLFRSGLRMVLRASLPGAQVFEAGSLNEALRVTAESPDAILLDIKLPGLNGLEGMALLRRKWPQVPVLVLSSQDEPETVRLALARGAAGFISKADSAENIVAMLARILHGDIIAATIPQENSVDADLHLTARQCEVLELLCQGMSNKLIARQLALSENTVRTHVQAILGYLKVTSRSEAAFAARRRGLVA